jgi:hypothetical protein
MPVSNNLSINSVNAQEIDEDESRIRMQHDGNRCRVHGVDVLLVLEGKRKERGTRSQEKSPQHWPTHRSQ